MGKSFFFDSTGGPNKTLLLPADLAERRRRSLPTVLNLRWRFGKGVCLLQSLPVLSHSRRPYRQDIKHINEAVFFTGFGSSTLQRGLRHCAALLAPTLAP